ncbi:MAG: antibiotic biosynthesis monooxygenase [Desulfobacteraceae bacterium]|jgi:heme-degrading monooxygenase HmoA|nr:antibiotic biosynthesis monooxygenase [Desulfobacteraceae bacterium]
MAIQVIIKRDVKQGRQAKELVPLILQMRASAMYQPGYISGETLCDMEHPGECIVISKWETIEDWNRWAQNQTRAMIDQKIETLTGKKSEYRIYSSMTPQPLVEKKPKRQAGQH